MRKGCKTEKEKQSKVERGKVELKRQMLKVKKIVRRPDETR